VEAWTELTRPARCTVHVSLAGGKASRQAWLARDCANLEVDDLIPLLLLVCACDEEEEEEAEEDAVYVSHIVFLRCHIPLSVQASTSSGTLLSTNCTAVLSSGRIEYPKFF
jgi:hypothetical protein